jgi:hypothetical protein
MVSRLIAATAKLSTVIVLLPLLLAGSCQKTDDLIPVKATSRNWAGGVYGRSGTDYALTLKPQLKEGLRLDTLYAGGEAMPLIETNNTSVSSWIWFWSKEGDTDVIRVSAQIARMEERYPNNPMGETEPKPSYPYPSFEGEGKLIYSISGTKKQLLIPSFEKLAPAAYP